MVSINVTFRMFQEGANRKSQVSERHEYVTFHSECSNSDLTHLEQASCRA